MSDGPSAGWYPDPHGGTRQRYWDGERWTDQVADAGGTTSPLSSPSDGRLELAERLRRPRPDGSLAAALCAAGGVIGVVAAFMVVSADGRTAANVVAVLVLVTSYVIALAGPKWARPAALPGAVAAPLFLVSNLADELDGRIAVILPALVVGAVWLAMFLFRGLRGAPVLMAGVLLAGWVVVLGATESAGPSDPTFGSSESFGTVTLDPFGTQTVDVPLDAAVSLVYALGVITAAAVLDRRGWHVLATPFIAVAVICSVAGLSEMSSGSSSDAGTSVLVMAVGAVLALVGGSGRRRGSTWIGAGLAAAGVSALVLDLADDPKGAGALLLLVAVGIVLAARPLERAVTTDEPDEVSAPAEF